MATTLVTLNEPLTVQKNLQLSVQSIEDGIIGPLDINSKLSAGPAAALPKSRGAKAQRASLRWPGPARLAGS